MVDHKALLFLIFFSHRVLKGRGRKVSVVLADAGCETIALLEGAEAGVYLSHVLREFLELKSMKVLLCH